MNKSKIEWRRFEFIDESKEDKLLELCALKNLSREDLMLILSTLRLRDSAVNLSNISTSEIVKELEGRKNVQMFHSELYSGYNISIIKKYSEDRTPIQLPTKIKALIIED